MTYIEHTEGTGSLLLEMPHSGMVGLEDPSLIPAVIADNLRASKAVQDTLNFGCDHAVPLMTGFDEYKKDPRTSTLQNDLARALTDPNRDEKEVSGYALEGRPTDANNSGVLMARTVPHGVDFSDRASMEEAARAQMEPMYARPFNESEFSSVLDVVYRPYHRATRMLHERIRKAHGSVTHLALHSLPAADVALVDGGYVIGRDVVRGALAFEPQTVLPDVVLIHNGFASCSRDRIELIKAVFEKAGLLVSHGTGPLTGNNGVTALYGDPAAGTHVVGIEHVTYGIEIDRHCGGLTLAENEAEALQAVYAEVFETILDVF